MPTKCWALKCTAKASFNHEGRKNALYCRRHADDSMVNVVAKRCAHAEGCTKQPVFNHAGSQRGAYCKRHAKESMVDVRSKRCAYAGGCGSHSIWGYWADGKRSVCAKHKGDLTDGLVINYARKCSAHGVKGCGKTVKWGVDGEHPTHCDEHGSQSAHFVRVPSGRTRTSAYYFSPGTTMGRSRTAGAGEGGRSGDHGGGGVKRVRKVAPPGGELTSGALMTCDIHQRMADNEGCP